MGRKVRYFNEDPRPREYIDSLPVAETANIDHRLDFMKENPSYIWPWVHHIEGKLWELKSGAHRLLYCLYKGDVAILHACRKVGRRLARGEIDLALKRLNRLYER